MEVLIILLWLGCAIVAGMMAEQKGRSGCGWLILGLMFGPLIILVVVVAAPNEYRSEQAGLQSRRLRRCPICAEAVQSAAMKCRYCGAELPPLRRVDWLGREIVN